MNKKGTKTSEFWMSIGVLVVATGMLFTNKITTQEWVNLVIGSNVGYALSRGMSKLPIPAP